MATQPVPKISEEEYLQRERAAEYKSEFVNGEIFAMSGGMPQHAALAAKFTAELTLQTRGGDCLVFISDLKVRSARTKSYLYPDVSVICGELELHPGANDVATNPVLVVEVLSPSTAAFDRGEKFSLYREIASLQDYLLVHTAEARVERFTRGENETWIFREYAGIESAVRLESVGCEIRLADVYDRVFRIPE